MSDTVVTHPLVKGEVGPGCAKVDPIVVADGVVRSFGGLTAVDVAHVEIPRGMITALIGPNGAGKTTFFNLLTGFDKPNAGEWSFEGHSLARRARLQGGPQGDDPHLPAHQVARPPDACCRTCCSAPRSSRARTSSPPSSGRSGGRRRRPSRRRREDLLARFKLDAKKEDYAASLSGGQRKLLEMARALMSDPALIMLDEPMAGVNPALTQSLLGHIKELKYRGHVGAVRRARHAHGAPHLRLGDRDGRGQGRRGGSARDGDERPRRHRRLPGRAPRHRPRRHDRHDLPGGRAARARGRSMRSFIRFRTTTKNPRRPGTAHERAADTSTRRGRDRDQGARAVEHRPRRRVPARA